MAVTHGSPTGHDFFSDVAITPMTESAAGVAVIILAILGLADIAPQALGAIAAIVIGAALLLQAATDVGAYGKAMATSGKGSLSAAEFGGGIAVAFLAGCTGVVLGVLALLGVAALPLVAVALMVFGSVLLIGGGMTAAMSLPRIDAVTAEPEPQATAHPASRTAAAASALIGLAGIVLGILALVHLQMTILVLVGLLSIGAALLLGGVATAAEEAAMLRR